MDKTSLMQLLKRMKDDASLVKAVIQKETSTARVLVDEDTKHGVEDLLLAIGNDVAVAESAWNAFGRISPFGKRYAVQERK